LNRCGVQTCMNGWVFCQMFAEIQNARGFPGCVLSIPHKLTHMVPVTNFRPTLQGDRHFLTTARLLALANR